MSGGDDPRLIVPGDDPEPWPTLGPEVCDWIEAFCVHGPGDVLGDPVELLDEIRYFIYRAYEIYPHDHPLAGRRRFKRVVLSRRKGFAKTEDAAFLAVAELDPSAPVRFDGWRKEGGEMIPVGAPVTDPYIPMVATTEEQVEDLAYGAAYEILTRGPLADDYDVGLERIVHKTAAGKMQPLASTPGARDGARTSFQHFDETHLFISARLKAAHKTMLRNIPKRVIADPWSLETTTMYGPGEDSVAEASHEYALSVATGKLKDASLLYDHRQASEKHDIATDRGLRAAIIEASGDAIVFTDVDGIVGLFRDPDADENENRRFWLNQRRKLTPRAFSLESWRGRFRKRKVADQELVVLGFDGSYRHDSTALVGATVEEHPHIFVIAVWEKPLRAPSTWRVPRLEVEAEIERAMERYDVAELVGDPPGWHRELEDWATKYGEVVVEFDTNQAAKFGPVCDSFEQAISDRGLTHDGSKTLERHVGHCVREKRGRYTVVAKSDPASPDKIDAAVAGILAYARARWHALNGAEPWAEVWE